MYLGLAMGLAAGGALSVPGTAAAEGLAAVGAACGGTDNFSSQSGTGTTSMPLRRRITYDHHAP